MSLPNIFSKEISENIIQRIYKLDVTTQPQWGKMNVAQMLAHCCVTYELIYEEGKHPKPGFLMKFILKSFIKKAVTSEIPYKRNERTAPAFLITGSREFEAEKNRLVGFILRTQKLGAAHFDQKVSHSFGALNTTEWNNMFYKHLDHHLTQFGV